MNRSTNGDGPGVLLCADDDSVAGSLVCAFARNGLVTTLAPDTLRGLHHVRVGEPRVVVVALADPEVTRGFVRDLRSVSSAMLVVVASEPLSPAEVAELGVHAQVPAGTDPALVSAQAAVLLDLVGQSDPGSTIEWGPLVLDTRTRRATWEGRPVEFTRLQFAILEVLVEAHGAVVSTDTLCERIWRGVPLYDGERLFAHIRRIRSKIEPAPDRPAFLLTVRGVGFRLADDTEAHTPSANGSRGWRGEERRRGDRRRLVANGSA